MGRVDFLTREERIVLQRVAGHVGDNDLIPVQPRRGRESHKAILRGGDESVVPPAATTHFRQSGGFENMET